MAKGNKIRSNREAKKPKADKKKLVPASAGAAPAGQAKPAAPAKRPKE